MVREVLIKVLPDDVEDLEIVLSKASKEARIPLDKISDWKIIKKSLDARKRPIIYQLRINLYIDEKSQGIEPEVIRVGNVSNAPHINIIGAGPAGLFAALQLIKSGLKPIILERGKSVRERRRDLASITRTGIVNPESNYCYGEGGAGTYSDGKLYTRSNKRGNLREVLKTLVYFGADPSILYEAHPHIGTNKLPQIIEEIRKFIISKGGEVYFNTKITDFIVEESKLVGLKSADKKEFLAENTILATGHSARDIYELLDRHGIVMESKGFALGVRIEHPQQLIDSKQYKGDNNELLPPASYSLVHNTEERGVYSFCMCPGGIVAPCATANNEVVTNGWSPSKRNNPYANSGIVVQLNPEDLDIKKHGVLAGLHFQKNIEQKAYKMGGGLQKVPAQRMVDYIEGKISSDLPKSSYIPGLTSCDLNELFPEFINKALKEGLLNFGKKIKGYLSNDAILHAPESRTSSPVRIPRDRSTLEHEQIYGLYPCAEGAGYAGGIISAAIDGERCANAIHEKIH